jgi:putative ABC transport system substrate-binding protein
VIEYRSAQGRPERLPEAAADLVRAKVELIVTSVNATSAAAKAAAQSIPIVMIVGTDVVAQGLAASLARPGGSITGLTWDVGLEIVAKRFELLKEAVPKATRIAVLWDPGQDAPGFKRVIEQGGAAVGATLIWPEVADEIEAGFEMAVRERAQALFTGGGARLFRLRKRVVELAAKHRLPDTHYTAEFVEAGGLMSYAPNLPDMFRRAATYVDRILRGAKPGDLPIEQPARLDLVINLRTAKALGLKLPQSLLIRADRVIE